MVEPFCIATLPVEAMIWLYIPLLVVFVLIGTTLTACDVELQGIGNPVISMIPANCESL